MDGGLKRLRNERLQVLQWRANETKAFSRECALRIVELDILRFLSTLCVLFHHYLAWYSIDFPRGSALIDGLFRVGKYAFVCLPLFFMISGFVILVSGMGRDARRFAIGRVVRLYPGYWIAVTITAGYALLSGVGESATVDPVTYLVNLTMLQSYLGFEKVDVVYWTLAIELQFYALILVLILCGVLHRVRVWLTIWTALTLTYIAFSQPFFLGWVIDPWYSPFFIGGIACAMIRREGPSAFYHTVLLISLALASYDTFDSTADFIADCTLFDRCASIAVICLFYLAFYVIATKRVQMKPSVIWLKLGGLTYMLYLLHNKAGKILMHAIEPRIGPEWAIAIAAVVALLVSYGLYEFIETKLAPPFRARLLAWTRAFEKQKTAGANPG